MSNPAKSTFTCSLSQDQKDRACATRTLTYPQSILFTDTDGIELVHVCSKNCSKQLDVHQRRQYNQRD